MGSEARCGCRWAGGGGEVKALLEARELILRGAVARKIPISAMRAVRIDADELCFEIDGETISLQLGAGLAQRWVQKIATPPPTLAHKLGVESPVKALVIGALDEPALQEALLGARAASPAEADLSVAIVRDAAGLSEAVRLHAGLPKAAPIWLVYPKGPKAAFGETAVRAIMRAAGYQDTKVSAVSDALSATRYSLPKGAG